MLTNSDAGRDRTKRGVTRRNRFFLIASVLMTLTVFLGFLPSFYLRFQFRTTPLPLYLVVHGVIMTCWQLMFLAQTIVVANGRIGLHRRLGQSGAVLAVLVVGVGIDATLRLPAFYAGKTLPFPIEPMVIGNLFGFLLFGGLVLAAIILRQHPASHRRLMYWACLVTVGPALTPGRSLGAMIAPYFPTTFPPEISLAWIGWIALLVNDWWVAKAFHPATIVGGVLLLFVMPALVDWILVVDGVNARVRSLAYEQP